jgi:hypothetical protein
MIVIPTSIRGFISAQMQRAGWSFHHDEAEEVDIDGIKARRLAVHPRIAPEWIAQRQASLGKEDAYFRSSGATTIYWQQGTESVLHWSCPPAKLEVRRAPDATPTDDAVIAALEEEVHLTPEHELFRATCARKFSSHLWRYEWHRNVGGIDVSGDGIYLTVNHSTSSWVSLHRGRCAPLPQFETSLPEDEACAIAAAWLQPREPRAQSAGRGRRSIQWLHGGYRRVWSFEFNYERDLTDAELAERDSAPPDLPAPDGPAETLVFEEDRDLPPPLPPTTTIETFHVSVDDDGAVMTSP